MSISQKLAAIANDCCMRSDGWEEHIAGLFEAELNRAVDGLPRYQAMVCTAKETLVAMEIVKADDLKALLK